MRKTASLDGSAILEAAMSRGMEVVEVSRSRGKALCPFHYEKTPSFSLNAKSESFYCFGCKAEGGVDDLRV